MNSEQPDIPRILIVDYEESFHAEVFRALVPDHDEKRGFFKNGLDKLAGKIIDRSSAGRNSAKYDLVSCFDFASALEEISWSTKAGNRFALILLDMKMVSAEKVLENTEKIRRLDPMVNILIMAAAPDFDSADISARLEPADKLFFVEKPFSHREINLLFLLLSAKWRVEGQLVSGNLELVAAHENLDMSHTTRTMELQQARSELDALRHDLRNKEEMLANQTNELEESSVAMKVLLKNIATEDPGLDEKVMNRKIREMDEKIILNAKELTEPFLDKLEMTSLDLEQQEYLAILRSNLDRVTAPVMQRLYSSDYALTPSELQVANLIRQGKSSKSIASLLNLSIRTIEFHRDNIRKKLGLKDRKTSLRKALETV